MYFDLIFLENRNKQIRKLKENNYSGVFFLCKDKEELKKPKIKDNFLEVYISLKPSSKYLSLGIFREILEFKENIERFDLFLLDFREKEDKMEFRNSLFNTSLAYLPKQKKGLLFPLSFFKNITEKNEFIYKQQILGRFRQNIKIVKKKKSQFLPIICSLNENKFSLDPFDRRAFGQLLGLNPLEAKKAVGSNLLFLLKQKYLNDKDFVIFNLNHK
jgi:hypothetical protein